MSPSRSAAYGTRVLGAAAMACARRARLAAAKMAERRGPRAAPPSLPARRGMWVVRTGLLPLLAAPRHAREARRACMGVGGTIYSDDAGGPLVQLFTKSG